MRVITLSGSPYFPSPSSAMLEYARNKLTKHAVSVYHWHLQNFVPEDLIRGRVDSPALQTLREQLATAEGVIIATPVHKAAFSGGLKTLLALLPGNAFEEKIVLPLACGGTVADRLALDYTLRSVLNTLKAQEVLSGTFADDNQVTDYQHKPLFTHALKQRLDGALTLFWQRLQKPHLIAETCCRSDPG